MSDIFISYAREDRPRAEAIAQALEAHGWTVWWDRKIPAGRKFSQVISEEIAKARCLLVLWSAASVEADFVEEEAYKGKRRGILVPVFLEEVDPPLGFSLLQAADLTGWDGDRASPLFQGLCTEITGHLGGPLPPERAPEPKPVFTSPKDGCVWIPPGEFWMGAVPGDDEAREDEKPRHRAHQQRVLDERNARDSGRIPALSGRAQTEQQARSSHRKRHLGRSKGLVRMGGWPVAHRS